MSAVAENLDALYGEIPRMLGCRGRCAISCGPIDMSDAERARIAERGVEIPVWTAEQALAWAHGDVTRDRRGACPALGVLGQCTVYDVRPMICRLWGATEGMPCPYGCQPERVLSDREALSLLARAMEVGGSDSGVGPILNTVMEDPAAGALVARLVRGDRSVEPAIRRRMHELARQANPNKSGAKGLETSDQSV